MAPKNDDGSECLLTPYSSRLKIAVLGFMANLISEETIPVFKEGILENGESGENRFMEILFFAMLSEKSAHSDGIVHRGLVIMDYLWEPAV